MQKNKVLTVTIIAALFVLPILSGCQSKPEETRDSAGHLQFPNTQRMPTAAEMQAIAAAQHKNAPQK